MATDGWSSHANLSTHAIDYTILVRHRNYEAPRHPQRCLLVSATAFPNGGRPALHIPCAACSGFNCHDEYYASWFRKLSRVFFSDYPFIPPCCVRRVVNDFLCIVEAANAIHCCPNIHPGVPCAITIVVEVHVQPRTQSQTHQQAMERALRESFEEAGRLKVRPATRASVKSLLAAKSSMEIEDGGDRQCVICMDKIETRKSALPMPCSHVFHEGCLLHWLSNSHVCPLCRWKCPTPRIDPCTYGSIKKIAS